MVSGVLMGMYDEVFRFRFLVTLNFLHFPSRGGATPWLCFYYGNYIPVFDVFFFNLQKMQKYACIAQSAVDFTATVMAL